jgi:hypothetical protein
MEGVSHGEKVPLCSRPHLLDGQLDWDNIVAVP